MTAPSRFYDPDVMKRLADLYSAAAFLIENFESDYGKYDDPDEDDSPLFISDLDIVVRHKDGYTVGRITVEDGFPVFELTDENYGEVTTLPDVATAIARHTRQEDTASGQPR